MSDIGNDAHAALHSAAVIIIIVPLAWIIYTKLPLISKWPLEMIGGDSRYPAIVGVAFQFAVIMVFFFIGLPLIGVTPAQMMTFVASLTIGVSFALRESITNFFMWLALLMTTKINKGTIVSFPESLNQLENMQKFIVDDISSWHWISLRREQETKWKGVITVRPMVFYDHTCVLYDSNSDVQNDRTDVKDSLQ